MENLWTSDSSMRRTGKAFIGRGDMLDAPQTQYVYPVRGRGSQQQVAMSCYSDKCAFPRRLREVKDKSRHNSLQVQERSWRIRVM